MAKYKLTFYGKKKPAMHALYPSLVERVVEASNETEASMKAYELHEHITGGAPGVKVELCQQSAAES